MNTLNNFIVDASVLIDYRAGAGLAKEIFISAVEERRNIAVSAVTVSIIWRLDDFDRRSEVGFSSLFQFLKVLPLDYDDSREIGHLMRGMDINGISELEIASVAALAKKNDYRIISSEPDRYDWTGLVAVNCEELVQN